MATPQIPQFPPPPKPDAQCGFGDPQVQLTTLDKYKGRKNCIDRLAFVGRNLMRGNSHFFNNKKFRCLTESAERPGICCERLGGPSQQFVIPVFKYVTDPQGNIANPDKCQGQLQMWILSETKYKELSTLHKQWPLLDDGFGARQHDLLINCTEEQYQKMSFVPANTAHWKSKESWHKTIVQRAMNAKSRISDALGRKCSEQEVKELLGIAPQLPAAAMPAATDIDLAGIADTPAMATSPAAVAPVAQVAPAPVAQPVPAPVVQAAVAQPAPAPVAAVALPQVNNEPDIL